MKSKNKLTTSIHNLVTAIYSDTGQVYNGECENEILILANAIENMIIEGRLRNPETYNFH